MRVRPVTSGQPLLQVVAVRPTTSVVPARILMHPNLNMQKGFPEKNRLSQQGNPCLRELSFMMYSSFLNFKDLKVLKPFTLKERFRD